MNNNTLPTQYNYPPTYITPTVAAIGIITLGLCACTCIVANVKYGLNTELTYKDFSLKSQKCQPETTVPCVVETV